MLESDKVQNTQCAANYCLIYQNVKLLGLFSKLCMI